MKVLGFDIGGTKCAVIFAETDENSVRILGKQACKTNLNISPEDMIECLIKMAEDITQNDCSQRIGVSCGGPLDSRRGIILGPPNLPGWKSVSIVDILKKHYNVPVNLQNDANACAQAEWKFGAGKGSKNMIFLTFGTGLGAGLILDGKLYTGTNDNAGECGHIRLNNFGPVGYGKAGSFEGFCSGGGLAQLGWKMAHEKLQMGITPSYWRAGMKPSEITAKIIADAANTGDETALEVYHVCGQQLGRGLALLIDLLNPERIVIGSIFTRQQNLLWESAHQIIKQEALPSSASCCQVVPSMLEEAIGDYAAVATALL